MHDSLGRSGSATAQALTEFDKESRELLAVIDRLIKQSASRTTTQKLQQIRANLEVCEQTASKRLVNALNPSDTARAATTTRAAINTSAATTTTAATTSTTPGVRDRPGGRDGSGGRGGLGGSFERRGNATARALREFDEESRELLAVIDRLINQSTNSTTTQKLQQIRANLAACEQTASKSLVDALNPSATTRGPGGRDGPGGLDRPGGRDGPEDRDGPGGRGGSGGSFGRRGNVTARALTEFDEESRELLAVNDRVINQSTNSTTTKQLQQIRANLAACEQTAGQQLVNALNPSATITVSTTTAATNLTTPKGG